MRHIMIGGFAVNAHGVIRPSRDLDIVPDPDPAYTALAANALSGELGGVPLRVCGLDDLIEMKRAAGRPRDRDDLQRLGASAK